MSYLFYCFVILIINNMLAHKSQGSDLPDRDDLFKFKHTSL